ncbi:MAG TPA: hypothetical protein VFH63_04075 [candidate division Zixibacteria bacterium]|nr:hypothetical protein [candidate division Zixibacteria bacterium]
MTNTDRGTPMTPTRRVLTVAGVATIAFSLVLSIAPVLAAPGNGNGSTGNGSENGNSGTVKVHLAATGEEAVGNDPQVCDFWVGFYASDPYEAGTWQLISWSPNVDPAPGTVVAFGSYDTTGDGEDVTGVLSPAPGHYRFEWLADGENSAKTKTLWVLDSCGADENPTGPSDPAEPTDGSQPSDEAGPSDPAQPTDGSQPSDPAEPTDGSQPSDQAGPTDEAQPTDAAGPTDGSQPSDQAEPTDGPQPSDPAEPTDGPQPSDEAGPTDEAQPTDGAEPTDGPQPSEEQEVNNGNPSPAPDPTQEVAEPESGIKAGNPTPAPARNPTNESGIQDGTPPMLPDTAVPVTESGVLATIGLLLIIAAQAGARRERSLPTA